MEDNYNISSEKNRLLALATQFRQAMEKAKFSFVHPQLLGFPYGACGVSSILLSQWLKEHGFKGMKYFCGTHHVGNENSQSHAWIQIDNLIVDITGDQFIDKQEYGYYDKAVYVGPMDFFHGLFYKDQVHDLNGYEGYDDHSKKLFASEYLKVKAYLI